MIDIHTHLIPGVDDGSESVAMSMTMMGQAVESGTTHVFCTPHVIDPGTPPFPDVIEGAVADLQARADAAGLRITLHPGSEVMIAPDMAERARAGTIRALGDSTYILVDLPMGDLPQYTEDALFDLLLAGYRPILAHPERCLGFVKKPAFLLELVRRGVLCQSNSGSFTGLFGPEVQSLAVRLVEAGQVRFIGSDGHTPGRRRMTIAKGLSELERATRANWRHLVVDNPRCILECLDLPDLEAEPLKAPRSWFGKLLGR